MANDSRVSGAERLRLLAEVEQLQLRAARLADTEGDRHEIAIAMFRKALSMIAPGDDPALWAKTQFNYATALVMHPTAIRDDNLEQAVAGVRRGAFGFA